MEGKSARSRRPTSSTRNCSRPQLARLLSEFGGTGRLRCSDYAPLRLSITGGSLKFDRMVAVVVLGREGRRGAGEKGQDVSTPWTMVVDDDNWSATWTSDHYQQPAERRTRTSVPTRSPKPNQKPTCSYAKETWVSEARWCAEVGL